MKTRISAGWLIVALGFAAETDVEKRANERTKAAVAMLEHKLDVQFTHPFPKEADIDVYRKQPIARLTTPQGDLFFTKPVVNPYDGRGTVEWLMGPPDLGRFGTGAAEGMLHFDDQGGFLQIGILSDDQWFVPGRDGTHQIFRDEGESPDAFLERAFREYHRRAVQSSEPSKALLYLGGVEKIVRALCVLRRAQQAQPPPPPARE